MHDWIFEAIFVDWKQSRVQLCFENIDGQKVTILVEGMVDVHVPQKRPWGPSICVNSVAGPLDAGNGLRTLQIEMQSGDIISIVAQIFNMPAQQQR